MSYETICVFNSVLLIASLTYCWTENANMTLNREYDKPNGRNAPKRGGGGKQTKILKTEVF
jgi:hypothetical protein